MEGYTQITFTSEQQSAFGIGLQGAIQNQKQYDAALACKTQENWPSMVGMQGSDAACLIHTWHPDLQSAVLAHDAAVTKDYRLERVRIRVDSGGEVVSAPTPG